MSSLYYQQRQHEQQQQQQHEQFQPPYHSHHHSYSQAAPQHSQQQHYHYQQQAAPHHSSYPHSHQQDQHPTPEHIYAPASSSSSTANPGNGSEPSQQQQQFAQSKEEVLETISAMMSQEIRSYNLDDYFSPQIPRPLDGERQQNVIHGAWREKICQWSYNVVDHFDLPREIVSISLNYFDRYMATLSKPTPGPLESQLSPGDLALLASLGTLHLATKVHATNHNEYDPQRGPLEEQHHKVPSLSTLANLSRGQFGPASICEMEKLLLVALDWKLHPPTLYALVTLLLRLIPCTLEDPLCGLSALISGELFEVAMYIAELSVCDAFFVERQIPSSTIALAAIVTAMDDLLLSQEENSLMQGFSPAHMRGSGCFTHDHKSLFLQMCSERLGLACRTPRDRVLLEESMDRLRAMYKGAAATEGTPVVVAAGQSSKEEAEQSPTTPQDELLQRQRTNSYNAPTSPSSIADMSLSTINSNMQSITEVSTTKRSDSIPTRNESMGRYSGRETPSSEGNGSNNFRYSPSPPSKHAHDDDEIRMVQEDPMVIAVRHQVDTSLNVSNEEHRDSFFGRNRTSTTTTTGTMMSCSPIVSSR